MEIKDKSGKILKTYPAQSNLVFSDQNLAGLELPNVMLEGGLFDNACLENADFSGGDLYWTYFAFANLKRVRFVGARLAGCNFDDANLSFADLSNAKLVKDNVGGRTSLAGAILNGAILSGADLSGASYDARTVFPEAFDPAAYGMMLMATE
jgi:uncharacterized protein YjbI with pentapeptide repeats